MRMLTTALYAEGTTDDRFLPIIIQRTAKEILLSNGSTDIDVVDPIPIDRNIVKKGRLEDNLLGAAKYSKGVHILFIHQDADTSTTEACMENRINPAIELINNTEDQVCNNIVPIIPIRSVEAWLISDAEALVKVVGSSTCLSKLNLPIRPQDVEKIQDPKSMYIEILKQLRVGRKRRRIDPGAYYTRLAMEINLDKLGLLSSFQIFKNALVTALIKENFLSVNRRTQKYLG